MALIQDNAFKPYLRNYRPPHALLKSFSIPLISSRILMYDAGTNIKKNVEKVYTHIPSDFDSVPYQSFKIYISRVIKGCA